MKDGDKWPARRQDSDAAEAVAAVAEEAFERLAGALSPGVIVLCDHAANALPAPYGTLGLPAAEFARHIAYDIGAREVAAARLAGRLGAPAVMTRFSRLLIDCNRGEDDPTLIMRLSDGAAVPGNRVLSAEERTRRIACYYRPYHDAIAALIDRFLGAGIVPVLLSVHSFTASWQGTSRPWHAAVLWDKDARLAAPLLAALRTDPALVVGDNEPYTGRLKGDCLWRHGTRRGLPHALLEIRQDLIAGGSGQAAWADRIAASIAAILAEPAMAADLRRQEFIGSNAD